MASSRADQKVTGKFALTFEATSPVPIVTVESPSHGDDFVIARHTPTYVQASLETSGGDLGATSSWPIGSASAHRHRRGHLQVPGEDGYFSLTLTAGNELAPHNTGMDYVFVLDISGSMADDGKLQTSRASVTAFIDGLGTDDRFEVIAFNVMPNPLFRQLQPASEENKSQGVRFLESQRARGGTVLDPAITSAYKYRDPDRPLNVVVLSDGLTDPGDRAELLSLIRARPSNARVFCVGVGNDVDRPLLEQIADDAGGLAAFMSRGDDFDRTALAFRRKLSRPAATNVEMAFDGVEVYDLEPKTMPNLYHGAPVHLYGRYRNGGTAKVSVRADLEGSELRQTTSITLPTKVSENPEIERMWAFHQIQRLLKDADRAGSREPVVGEIVRLGEAYSIVSEYTSFLVLENDAEYQRWKLDRHNALRTTRDRKRQQQLDVELASIRRGVPEGLGSTDNVAVNASGATQVAQRSVNQVSTGGGGATSGGGALDPVTGLMALSLASLALARRRQTKARGN